jgi:hypothetical protein
MRCVAACCSTVYNGRMRVLPRRRHVGLRISEELAAELEAAADEQDADLSTVIRSVLLEWAAARMVEGKSHEAVSN